jgi:HNH endonuclease
VHRGSRGDVCHQLLENGEDLHVHHVLPKRYGGTDDLANLRLVPANCRRQIHSTSVPLGVLGDLHLNLPDAWIMRDEAGGVHPKFGDKAAACTLVAIDGGIEATVALCEWLERQTGET